MFVPLPLVYLLKEVVFTELKQWNNHLMGTTTLTVEEAI